MLKRLLPVLLLLVAIGDAVGQDNGTRIVFMTDIDGNREIYSMLPDGTDFLRLTSNSDQDLDPQWSPDGSQIVFISNRNGLRNQVYVMDADGSNVRRVTTDDNSFHDFPSWSPDGNRILYVSDVRGNNDIYSVSVNGQDERRLTDSEEYELSPQWSPNGRSIAYLREVDFVNKIFLMDASGGNQRRLIDDFENIDDTFSAPAWSPDGTQLAFAVTFFFAGGTSLTEIYTYDLATSEPQLVTSYTEAFVDSLSWSADGESLVFDLQPSDENWQLTRFDLTSVGTSVLTRSSSNAQYGSWYTPELVGGGALIADGGTEVVRAPDSNIACAGTLNTRLVVDEVAQVTRGGTSNRLRSGPGVNNRQLASIPPGEQFIVLAGPECNGGYAWWEVNYQGTIGWTAEASSNEYWLERTQTVAATAGLTILTGGRGLTNGAAMGPGEFQVEYYCNQIGGYGVTRNDNTWFCTRGGSRVVTLGQDDFDQICQDTYRREDAIARRFGDGPIPAFRWRCYVQQF